MMEHIREGLLRQRGVKVEHAGHPVVAEHRSILNGVYELQKRWQGMQPTINCTGKFNRTRVNKNVLFADESIFL